MDKKFELRLFEFENFNLSENNFDRIYDVLDSAKKKMELIIDGEEVPWL